MYTYIYIYHAYIALNMTPMIIDSYWVRAVPRLIIVFACESKGIRPSLNLRESQKKAEEEAGYMNYAPRIIMRLVQSHLSEMLSVVCDSGGRGDDGLMMTTWSFFSSFKRTG